MKKRLLKAITIATGVSLTFTSLGTLNVSAEENLGNNPLVTKKEINNVTEDYVDQIGEKADGNDITDVVKEIGTSEETKNLSEEEKLEVVENVLEEAPKDAVKDYQEKKTEEINEVIEYSSELGQESTEKDFELSDGTHVGIATTDEKDDQGEAELTSNINVGTQLTVTNTPQENEVLSFNNFPNVVNAGILTGYNDVDSSIKVSKEPLNNTYSEEEVLNNLNIERLEIEYDTKTSKDELNKDKYTPKLSSNDPADKPLTSLMSMEKSPNSYLAKEYGARKWSCRVTMKAWNSLKIATMYLRNHYSVGNYGLKMRYVTVAGTNSYRGSDVNVIEYKIDDGKAEKAGWDMNTHATFKVTGKVNSGYIDIRATMKMTRLYKSKKYAIVKQTFTYS
jgi:hypothetical protein